MKRLILLILLLSTTFSSFSNWGWDYYSLGVNYGQLFNNNKFYHKFELEFNRHQCYDCGPHSFYNSIFAEFINDKTLNEYGIGIRYNRLFDQTRISNSYNYQLTKSTGIGIYPFLSLSSGKIEINNSSGFYIKPSVGLNINFGHKKIKFIDIKFNIYYEYNFNIGTEGQQIQNSSALNVNVGIAYKFNINPKSKEVNNNN